MQTLRLTDPNGHTVSIPFTVTTVVVADDQADAMTRRLLEGPAEEHASHMRTVMDEHAKQLGSAAGSSLNGSAIYRASNYTVLSTPITEADLAEQIAYYAPRFLEHRRLAAVPTLGYSNGYAYAAWGMELAGLLGNPDLRGAELAAAAESALAVKAA